jgi:2-methylcitrate dehydratase PrpD
MTASHAAALRRIYSTWRTDSAGERARATARLGIFDVFGCIVGGVPTETATLARRLAVEQGGAGPSAVLGSRERLAAPLAAFANGVAGHVLDYDDMNSTTISHPSVVLVPAAFAVAQARASTGRELVDAYVLGFEIGGYFGRAMAPAHYNAGWHSTATLGIFGATAACARLFDLDADRAMHALGIAASHSAGLRANFGSMTKSLHAGQAAEAAVRAAILASGGFTANPGVFDGPIGYFACYRENEARKPDPAGLEIESSGIGIKPYACCGAGVAVIDAALDLRAAHGFDPAQVRGVDVVLSEMAAMIMPYHEADDGAQAKYSHAYCAAVALLDNRGGLAQFADERVRRDDVQQLVRRTRVRADPRMTQGGGKFGVEMKVTLADGRVLETSLEVPRGHPTRPLEADRRLDKFLECAVPVIGEAKAREAATRIEAVETLRCLDPIVAALTPGE